MAKPSTDKTPARTAKRGNPPAIQYYLVAYNVLSALGWAYVLVGTLAHVLNGDTATATPPASAKSLVDRVVAFILSFLPSLAQTRSAQVATHIRANVPTALLPYVERASTTYWRIGPQTAFVQSFALLEIVHVLLGWVRSPLVTTAMQVASRLFLVWGVVEKFEVARTNPLYATMVFAWSLTEVIRYSFYACNLLGTEPYPLVYLRYTTFYLLYPLGAGSEAFVNFSTLPSSSPITSQQNALSPRWHPYDYVRGVLFVIWWPGLYVMYTYMITQRRKVIGGTGNRLRYKSKSE